MTTTMISYTLVNKYFLYTFAELLKEKKKKNKELKGL